MGTALIVIKVIPIESGPPLSHSLEYMLVTMTEKEFTVAGSSEYSRANRTESQSLNSHR
jgi:hypothetical protein